MRKDGFSPTRILPYICTESMILPLYGRIPVGKTRISAVNFMQCQKYQNHTSKHSLIKKKLNPSSVTKLMNKRRDNSGFKYELSVTLTRTRNPATL